MADSFRKWKSLYSATTNSFGTGEAVTITPSSVSGLPTDTEIVLTFDREVEGKLERIKGTISGGNFVVSSGGRGYDGTTEQSHTSPTVEHVPNGSDINDMVDGLLVEHNQDGTHSDITADSITTTDNASIGGTLAVTGATTLDNLTVGGKRAGTIYDNGDSGTSKEIDWNNGETQKLTLTGNCTLTFANAASGGYLTLFIDIDDTGGYTLTLPSDCIGVDGTEIEKTANAKNSVGFRYDGSKYRVFVQGNEEALAAL